MKKFKNNTKGITLVVLVITIIILLILAGITISSLTNTGIFEKAKEAKEKTIKENEKEQIQLILLNSKISTEGYEKLNQNNLQKLLNEQFGTNKIIVTNNEDNTFSLNFIDTRKRIYY